jgi:hypothetical protein
VQLLLTNDSVAYNGNDSTFNDTILQVPHKYEDARWFCVVVHAGMRARPSDMRSS